MSKYKSLLFRELKLSGHHYLFRFIMIILMTGVGCLTVFLNREERLENRAAIAMFITYVLAVIAGAVIAEDSDVFKSDINTGWFTYSYALPITAFEKTMAGYLVKAMAILLGAVSTLLGAWGINKIAGISMDKNVFVTFFIVLDIFLAFHCLIQAASLLAKDMKQSKAVQGIAAGVILVIAFACIVPNLISHKFFESFSATDEGMAIPNLVIGICSKLADKLQYAVLPFTLVLLALGFLITLKKYGRREV